LIALEAEQSVIGAALYDPEKCGYAFERLKTEMFYEPVHQAIWHQIAVGRGFMRRVDIVSLIEHFGDDGALARVGGSGYLADLVDRATVWTVQEHTDIVLDRAMRRGLVEAARLMIEEVGDLSKDGFDHVADAERVLGSMVQDCAPPEQNLIDARSSVLATLEQIEDEALNGRSKGVLTGLRCIDRRMRGLRAGWLVVIAGRPSMGKTALARAAALGAARKNPQKKIIFFALEMSRRELDERTLAQLSWEAGDGIPYKDMHGDALDPSQLKRLPGLVDRVPSNFIMDDSPVLTVDYVRRRVLARKRLGPVGAVFIDYLQIMNRPEAKGRNEASVIGEMTKMLKQLARECDTCVVLLSQINRGVETRDDKRPQLSDLRESGAIEQDANAVLFPYREGYYVERAEPKPDASADKVRDWETQCENLRRRMDVIAAKVRGGAIGTDQQVYYAEYDHIHDCAEGGR
jgi:replicative DNA helicase